MSRLLVFSIDALQTHDLEYLKNKENFKKILAKCFLVKNVREIYPTLTYPIHTSIITGVYPNEHGIFHNQKPSITQENPDWSIMGSNWYWYSDYVKVPSLMDAANCAGKETASVLWPVMAGHKPKHNLAEIWPNSEEDMLTTFKRACTPDMVELYYDKYLKDFDWEHRTDMDSYGMEITIDTIKRVKPDFMLVHVIGPDHIRHEYGDESVMLQLELDRVDAFLGRVFEACKEAGIYDDTNFVILGDHGQIDIHNIFNLNVLFAEYGLIRLDSDGNVSDYDAYSFSAGFSTHIMLKNPDDKKMQDKVYRILYQISQDFSEYMGRIYTKPEVLREEGLDGEFSFVIEAADHVVFDNPVVGEVIKRNSGTTKGYTAMHGHHPSKGPKPPFIIYGVDIHESTILESASMMDECPTMAKLLGVDMPLAVGKSLI